MSKLNLSTPRETYSVPYWSLVYTSAQIKAMPMLCTPIAQQQGMESPLCCGIIEIGSYQVFGKLFYN